jgi:hypothetical protein
MSFEGDAHDYSDEALQDARTALREVKRALHTKHHFLVVRRDSWFIRHPLECREFPDGCEMTLFMLDGITPRLQDAGDATYLMTKFQGVTMELDVRLDKVDDATDPMMTRLKKLGVW